MKKYGLILLILGVLNSKSQNAEFKDEMQWNTYVCGSVVSEDVQLISDSLSVTPNPFQKRTCAFYSFQNSDTISLTVYNVVAQVILSPKTNSLMPSGFYQDSLVMDAFPDGVYFVVLKTGQQTINKKIIKAVNAGIGEKNLDYGIGIYPNPVLNTLYISTEQNGFENAEVEITNYLGQIALKQPYSASVNVSQLSNGYYLFKIVTSDKQQFYSRFIKQ